MVIFATLSNFHFPASEKSMIIRNEHGIYELPNKLPNDVRLTILENQKTSEKSQTFIDLQPDAHDPCQE